MVIKEPMAQLNFEFCDKVKRENWAMIDSFYISDHNLTMIFDCKKSPPWDWNSSLLISENIVSI